VQDEKYATWTATGPKAEGMERKTVASGREFGMKRGILIVACGLAALWGCGGCQTLEALGLAKPTAYLRGVSFGKIDLEAATLLFDVEVENPYGVPLPLLNMDYALSSSDKPLFSGAADVATTIPARSRKTVSLPATVRYLDLWNALREVRPGAQIDYRADVDLSVEAPVAGPITLPLTKEGQLTVPTLPTPDSVDWKSRVLDAIRGESP